MFGEWLKFTNTAKKEADSWVQSPGTANSGFVQWAAPGAGSWLVGIPFFKEKLTSTLLLLSLF